jgi:hypothetical protein
MSGCNCIGAEAWLAYRPLQTLRSGSSAVRRCVARQGSSARQITSSELSSRVSCVEERLTSYMRIISVASGEQQHRQMSGWCIGQKHGGVPQRPALQTRSERSSAVTRCVARQGVLNCRSRGSELSSRVSCHRATDELRGSSSVASGEQQHGAKCLDAIVLEQRHGGVPQRPALQTLRSGSVQSPDVLHARGPQLHARSREFRTFGRVSCQERLTSYADHPV